MAIISVAAIVSRLVSSSGDRGTVLLEKKDGIDDSEEGQEEIFAPKLVWIHHDALIYILVLKGGKDKFNDDPQPLPIIDSFRRLESWGETVDMGLMSMEDILMQREGLLSCLDQLSLLTIGLSSAFLLLPFYDKLPLLKNPKFFWPVVEKIGNQIHIFESVPNGMSDPSFTPSHQVLDLDNPNHEWEIVPPLTVGFDLFICGHVVVGDKIFAKHRWFDYEEFSVFDCNTRKWEIRHSESHHLTQYTRFECSICVDRFYKTGCKSPFYLVIMFDNDRVWNDYFLEVSAIALCVTEEGYVMWTQHLPQFFDGLGPMTLLYAHVFRVDEKTMCVVMFANCYPREGDGAESVLYIATFCLGEDSKCQEGGVKAVLKERRIYKTAKDFPSLPQHLRACVSTFPRAQCVFP